MPSEPQARYRELASYHHDMSECTTYCEWYDRYMRANPEARVSDITRRSFLGSAIICYARPFKTNYRGDDRLYLPHDYAYAVFERIGSPEWKENHTTILDLRDSVVAHGDHEKREPDVSHRLAESDSYSIQDHTLKDGSVLILSSMAIQLERALATDLNILRDQLEGAHPNRRFFGHNVSFREVELTDAEVDASTNPYESTGPDLRWEKPNRG